MHYLNFRDLDNNKLKGLSLYKKEVLIDWGFTDRQIATIILYRDANIQASETISDLLLERSFIYSMYGFGDVNNYFIPEGQNISSMLLDEESSTTENAHDLTVKYQDTFGIYKKLNKIALIKRIEKIDRLSYIISFIIINGDHSFTNKTTSKISDFDMTLPKLGFINHDDYVILLERLHKKESSYKYRKGLHNDSLSYLNISKNELKIINKINHFDTYYSSKKEMMYKIAPYLFLSKFYTYEEALSLLLDGNKLSCAISPLIALRSDFKRNKIVLYKSAYNIGSYVKKTNSFKLVTDLFNKELDDVGVIHD